MFSLPLYAKPFSYPLKIEGGKWVGKKLLDWVLCAMMSVHISREQSDERQRRFRERRKTDKEHVAKSELGEEEAAAVTGADVRYNVKG